MDNKNSNIIITTQLYNDYKISKINGESQVKLIEIKRENLDRLSEINSQICGIYFLINNRNNSKNIYIGESGKIAKRIKTHINQGKEFYKAYIFWLCHEDVNESHWKYLEHHYIKKWENSSFFDNAKTQEVPKVNEWDIITINKCIDQIDKLIKFIGIDEIHQNVIEACEDEKQIIFESKNNQNTPSTTVILYFSYNDKKLKLEYNAQLKLEIISGRTKWTLLKGSEISLNNLKEDDYERKILIKKSSYKKFIDSLEMNKNFSFNKDKNKIILIDNIPVSSISLAAEIVSCYNAMDGWTKWKNEKNGVSAKEAYPEIHKNYSGQKNN